MLESLSTSRPTWHPLKEKRFVPLFKLDPWILCSLTKLVFFKYCKQCKTCFRCFLKREVEGVLTSPHFQILLQSPPPHLNPLWGPQWPTTLGTLRVKFSQHFQIFLSCQSPPQPRTIFQNTQLLSTPSQALCGRPFWTFQQSLQMGRGSVQCAVTQHPG